jgi:hypothetical protein
MRKPSYKTLTNNWTYVDTDIYRHRCRHRHRNRQRKRNRQRCFKEIQLDFEVDSSRNKYRLEDSIGWDRHDRIGYDRLG